MLRMSGHDHLLALFGQHLQEAQQLFLCRSMEAIVGFIEQKDVSLDVPGAPQEVVGKQQLGILANVPVI